MSESDGVRQVESDATLVEKTRAGDQRAFAELWHRHYRSGARVARQFTSSLDADDLVSEAFTRIYKRVLAGGGPTGAFRPYLYTTIRNLASSWGAASRDVQVDDIADFTDPNTEQDPAAVALDRTLTARAFRSLPDRWQAVLWYTEVEGLDPHEVAPLLGMTANGVAALSYRAREGLRKAWLQAHITDAAASGECQWAIARIGDHARRSLTPRDSERMSFHLATCAKCAIICEEVDEVGSHLAHVMLPIMLGGVAGGTFLASLSSPSMATASSLIPAAPDMMGAGSAAVAGVSGFTGLAAVSAPTALVGTLALAVAVTGSVVALAPLTHTDTSSPPTASSPLDPSSTADSGGGDTSAGGSDAPASAPRGGADSPAADDPANIPDGLTQVDPGVDELIDATVDTITGGAAPEGHTAPGGIVGTDIALNLIGTATPGAHLSLQAAGQVYATTTVDSNGNFTINVTALPEGLSSLELVQTVDRNYLASIVGGGVLGGVLGTLDQLVNALIKPLSLSSGGSAINIILVG